MEAFVSDMLILAGRFSEPAADGAAYQAAGGWFSSASVLETWDLRFSGHANILFVPDEKTRFSVSNEELALLEISGATSAEMPTAFGGASPVMLEGEITIDHCPSCICPAFGGIAFRNRTELQRHA